MVWRVRLPLQMCGRIMDPLFFLDPEQLLRFFHCHKTEMSLLENPHTFLCKLRDHDLIPEERYQKVTRMKSKENVRKALYDILDWLEKECPQNIKIFWECVFSDTMLSCYPTLRILWKSLTDGSFDFNAQLPERVEKAETDKGKRKELSKEDKEDKKNAKSVKKRRKLSSVSDDEDEQPGPSTQLTPGQKKKSKKISFSSPLKRGEKSDIWDWPIFRSQLPVKCGSMEGTLNREKLAKGERCIAVKRKWFTPTEFERFAGKERYKNWKLSIRCRDVPLGKLIQEGHMKSPRFKGAHKRVKKSLFPSDHSSTGSDEEEDENEEEEDQVSSSSKESSADVTGDGEEEEQTEPGTSQESRDKVFKVTCRNLAGTLHVNRFASGTCGKSIRTETSWLTPMEFLEEATGQTDASWKKDIEWNGSPLSVLIEGKVLKLHPLLCSCRLCEPENEDLEDQKNDDECCICKEKGQLVVCDECPRAFHQECHLPHVEDAILQDASEWMCTFCIFRTYSWDQQEREAAMSRQISQHMLQCQYLVLLLCAADDHQTFTADPRRYLDDYSTVIQTPMWLSKIADKLQSQLYRTVGEFVSDVQLIFTNCATYNRANAEFLATGDTLKRLFDEGFKSAFNIREETLD